MATSAHNDGRSLPMKHLDEFDHVEVSPKDGIATVQPDRRLERRTVMKLDLLLVPIVCGLYLLAFLDRANIGNARVAGLQEDLRMSDKQYQTAITVTYVPYILAELPSNLILSKIGPRILLPSLCVGWGIVTTLQSQVKGYAGLLACRFFLGLLEGGLFPGIVLYLSGFYRRHELQMRIGLFFSAAAMSGAFSGLLAAAIVQMNGVGGLTGWRWIFIIEGLFTILFGIMTAFLLPNAPHQVKTFTSEQAKHCLNRIEADGVATESTAFSAQAFFSTFRSLHIWLLCIALFCNGTSLFGLAYFTPSIVQGMGYGSTMTQLLTVPPFAIAFVATLISAFVADRFKARGLASIATTLLSLIGFAIFFESRTVATRYVALCFMITGVYSTAPSLISWIPNNVASRTRRATAVAMGFISTNVGGILSTWIYPKSASPRYELAAILNLSLVCFSIVLITGEIGLLRWKNQRKEQEEHRARTMRAVENMNVDEQFELLGDEHPDFTYTL